MKESYYIFIFDAVKIIKKNGIINIIDNNKKDKGISLNKSISYIYGSMKIPDQLPFNIAEQLIKQNKAREISKLEWKYLQLYIELVNDETLTYKQYRKKIYREFKKLMNNTELIEESLPLLKKELELGNFKLKTEGEMKQELKKKKKMIK